MKEQGQARGRTANGGRLDIQAAKKRCEAAPRHRQTGQNVAEDGWCDRCQVRWPCPIVYLAAALEALEETRKAGRKAQDKWEEWVESELAGTSQFRSAMREVKKNRAILGESE